MGVGFLLVAFVVLRRGFQSAPPCDEDDGAAESQVAPVQPDSEKEGCASNVLHLARSFGSYLSNHDGATPKTMRFFAEEMTLETRWLACPSAQPKPDAPPNMDSWGDYVFPSISAKRVAAKDIVVFCRFCRDRYGETAAGCADGTVAHLSAQELAERLSAQGAKSGGPAVAFDAAAENSGGFRGPQRDGRFPAVGLLAKWPEGGPKLAWKATIAKGWTAASVAGGSVFFCGADWTGQMWSFSLDGNLQWIAEYGPEGAKAQGAPRGTPVVADGRIFYASLPGVLYCLDAANGKVVWRAEIGKAGPYSQSASPLVCGELVVVSLCSRSDEVPSFAAFRRQDGSLAWKGDLGPCPEAGKGWSNFHSSPIPVRAGDRLLVVDQFFRCLGAVDAQTGGKVWALPTTAYSASPTSHEGYLLMQGSRMLRVLNDGTVKELWTRKLGIQEYGASYSHSTILNGRLFIFTPGAIKMISAETGEELARAPCGRNGSLQMAEGRLYVLDGRPCMTLIRPTDKTLEVVSSFKPEIAGGENMNGVYTHAVIAEGRLFLRNQAQVVVYDLRAAEKEPGERRR
jgi:outer membrane protein assembly factor BamB